LVKVAFEGLGELAGDAGEDGVSGKAAGVEGGVGEIADELARIAALETEGGVDGVFDTLWTGHFQQNHGIAPLPPLGLQIRIAGCEFDAEALLDEGVL